MRSFLLRKYRAAILAAICAIALGFSSDALASASGVNLAGPFTATWNGSMYDVRAGSICNYGAKADTNTLRIELWALPQPYTGGTPNGYRLANSNVTNGLLQNQCYSSFDTDLMYPRDTPVSGNYHAVVFLAEYANAPTDDGFVYDDWANLPDTVSVSAGVITIDAVPTGCTPDATTLCLDDLPGDRRFMIRASFHTSQGTGQSGNAHPVLLSTLGVAQGGLLWFFSANNPEVLLKVVNGCALNNRYWVFASAGTNVGVNLTVTDTVGGTSKSYVNPDLQAWAPVQDTGAFVCR